MAVHDSTLSKQVLHMTLDWQRTLPVIVSILIIIAIAILRQYSKMLAAVVAVMPVNVPLGLVDHLRG